MPHPDDAARSRLGRSRLKARSLSGRPRVGSFARRSAARARETALARGAAGALVHSISMPRTVASCLEELAVGSADCRFGMHSIGDAGMPQLCSALASAPVVRLDLSCNSLNAASAAPLARLLDGHATLEGLDVSANALADGVGALAEVLARPGSALRALDVHANSVRDDGAVALAAMLRSNVTLTALDLRNNYLTDVSARALSGAWPKAALARSSPCGPPTKSPLAPPKARLLGPRGGDFSPQSGCGAAVVPSQNRPPSPHHLKPSRLASLGQTKTLRLCHLQGNDITPQMWASLEQLVADPTNSLESIEGADNATAELMGTVCLVQ